MGVETFMGARVADFDPPVRGDAITADRYYSAAWMQREWDRLWGRIWHLGGVVSALEETGDYVVHNFMRESVMMIRQADGSVKAFYNACKHRGNRLVWSEMGGADVITCSYHGWQWAPDGELVHVQDAEDFPGGNPCGKVRLKELRCETWGGFIWYSMDPDIAPLVEWLAPLPGQLIGYGMEAMVRVLHVSCDVPCNWKIIRDNFNESYHLPTLHPELATFIDDDYTDTSFEMYPSGHNRMVQKGCQPSGRLDLPDVLEAPLDDLLGAWELDPIAFHGRAREARLALQRQKRALGPARGFKHHDSMTDSQLTDYYHYTLWPNVTITMSPDGFQILRSEPHPTDPERCIFEHWYMMPPVPGRSDVITPVGMVPFAPAEKDTVVYGTRSLGYVADQDMSIAVGQQQGLHSHGYDGAHLSGQEKRIQRFHELLDDFLKA